MKFREKDNANAFWDRAGKSETALRSFDSEA